MNLETSTKKTIPISKTVIENLFVMDAKSAGVDYPMIFDTGATVTVINESLAAALNAHNKESVITGRGSSGNTISANMFFIETLTIGDMKFTNLDVLVVPDKSLDFGVNDKGERLKVSGFLGWNVIKEYKWLYDYKKKSFNVEKSTKQSNPIGSGVSLIWDNMPIISAKVEDKDISIGFDTGLTNTMLSKQLYSEISGDIYEETITGIDGSSVEKVKIIETFDIKIENDVYSLNNITCLNRELFPTSKQVIGLLGSDVLLEKCWSIDFVNGSLSILS